ncbi:Protein of unknown function [Pyronema omphalodes CBS 100304]|uniref:Uncharacterized protein n=1 Tax=Pyronema omphalodes (strain CBS 100304) TaxID=1076935 RepID=U4LKC4_PYROM|nr:Protein of unknown function [Pyronema omphalodes CBS 100304]
MSDVVDLKLKLYLLLSSKVPRSTQLLMQGKIIGLSYVLERRWAMLTSGWLDEFSPASLEQG